MKTMTLTLGEKSLQNLHRFLGRADLKGHEVPDFLQLLQELRPAEKAEAVPAPSPSSSR
jgi:hypothetical protein